MNKLAKEKPPSDKKLSIASQSPAGEIVKRQTKELVLAFCGPAGSGISAVVSKMEEVLKDRFNYEVKRIKISDFIKQAINKRQIQIDGTLDETTDQYTRIIMLQDGGNRLRKKYSANDILAQLTVKDIAFDRQGRNMEDEQEGATKDEVERKTYRVAYLIDSLKHPEEVNLLRVVYGNMFYLFGVLCPHVTKIERLEKKRMTHSQASEIIERDKRQEEPSGQKLIKTLQYADFFIRNNHPNLEILENHLKRFVHLILGTKIITPTNNEYAMYVAQSVALKSACLSRQVGAVIINSKGDIIATGCNDVPKPGGGLYSYEDGSLDVRCMKKSGEICMNDSFKKKIKEDISSILAKSKNKIPKDDADNIATNILLNTLVGDLIEFSRAVHAEMDAIISAARNSNVSIKDSTLFTTTFPCHDCARHIIAAGITKVYYIEPYEKSLALDLHNDAIMMEGQEKSDKVVFLHFEGVAPRQYQNLFRPKESRKKDGYLIRIEPSTALPVIPQYLDSFFAYETKVVKYLDGLGF